MNMPTHIAMKPSQVAADGDATVVAGPVGSADLLANIRVYSARGSWSRK